MVICTKTSKKLIHVVHHMISDISGSESFIKTISLRPVEYDSNHLLAIQSIQLLANPF